MPPREAVALFRDVAVGLLHAHGKGVLHCDLKPANVLLDQDSRPRLADFGQSRLSHEQTPALGTLFYMAPEQADLQAVPDVRWDVYALGALLYCMLTGAPPYRSEAAVTEFETAADLEERLARYRQLIETSPPPADHRQMRGRRSRAGRHRRRLPGASIASERYANVQEVLDALNARDRRRARRPLVLLGFVGPALLLAVMSVFAWSSFETVMDESDEALRERALDSNSFAAKYVAKTVTNELEVLLSGRRRNGGQLPVSGTCWKRRLDDPEIAELRRQLNDPQTRASRRASNCEPSLSANPARQELQERVAGFVAGSRRAERRQLVCHRLRRACSWPARRTKTRWATISAWRTYFHGGDEDFPRDLAAQARASTSRRPTSRPCSTARSTTAGP